MSISELACTYATLILDDEDTAITADKIAALVKAANVNVESYWPALFARLAEKRNIADLISNVGSPGAGAPVAAAAGAGDVAPPAAATPAAEEKKKEDDEEVSDEDMGLGLFD